MRNWTEHSSGWTSEKFLPQSGQSRKPTNEDEVEENQRGLTANGHANAPKRSSSEAALWEVQNKKGGRKDGRKESLTMCDPQLLLGKIAKTNGHQFGECDLGAAH